MQAVTRQVYTAIFDFRVLTLFTPSIKWSKTVTLYIILISLCILQITLLESVGAYVKWKEYIDSEMCEYSQQVKCSDSEGPRFTDCSALSCCYFILFFLMALPDSHSTSLWQSFLQVPAVLFVWHTLHLAA